ncbi:hypothetical protein ABPG75_006800 [Micractinium tetrahymenae]
MLRAARSVAAWLRRFAAGHVTRLRFATGYAQLALLSTGHEMDERVNEAHEELLALLPGLNSRGQLLEASLDFVVQVVACIPTSPFWSISLYSLRRLFLDFSDVGAFMQVLPPLRLLAGLQDLELRTTVLHLPAERCFPGSLTRLLLKGSSVEGDLSFQASALPSLATLHLRDLWMGPSRMSFLERLPSLRRLELEKCAVPACLSRLTQLDTLVIDRPHASFRQQQQQQQAEGGGEAALSPLAAGLPPLTQLTQLALHQVPNLPATLGSLASLRRCAWVVSIFELRESGAAAAALPLQPGPWLASLRELALPAELAGRSLGVLTGATALDFSEASFLAVADALRRKPALRLTTDAYISSVRRWLWPEPSAFEPWPAL